MALSPSRLCLLSSQKPARWTSAAAAAGHRWGSAGIYRARATTPFIAGTLVASLIRPLVKHRRRRAFDASPNAESRAHPEKSGFRKEAEYLLISSELFENLSLSRRSWFALRADSPAVVHTKDAIKGICSAVSFCACRMLHAKQWKCLPHYLWRTRQHTTSICTHHKWRVIAG